MLGTRDSHLKISMILSTLDMSTHDLLVSHIFLKFIRMFFYRKKNSEYIHINKRERAYAWSRGKPLPKQTNMIRAFQLLIIIKGL